MTTESGAGWRCAACRAAVAPVIMRCANCGVDFTKVGPVFEAEATEAASAAAVVTGADTAASLAAIAWIVVAVATVYLAYLQWSTARVLETFGQSSASLDQFAVLNAASAAISLVFAAKLLVRPTLSSLSESVLWGVLSVAGVGYELATGATHWTLVIGAIGAAVAAVLSWAARPAFVGTQPAGAPTSLASAASPSPEPTPPVAPILPATLVLPSAPPASSTDGATAAALDRSGIPLPLILGGILLLAVVLSAGAYALARGGPAVSPSPAPTQAPAAIATQRPTPVITPISIEFGSKANADGAVVTATATFKKGSAIYWFVEVDDLRPGTAIIQLTGAASGVDSTSDLTVKSGGLNDVSGSLSKVLAPDSYVLTMTQNGTILATGSFTVTA